MKKNQISDNKKLWFLVALVLCFLFILWLGLSLLKRLNIQLRYQGTGSMPEGFYLQYPARHYHLGENIVFYPNQMTENLMLKRGWLHQREPLLKKIVAKTGDWVCIKNNYLWINKAKIAFVFKTDRKGKLLPSVKICRYLAPDEYWVEGIASEYSFDSRYFGVINKQNILGKVIKL